MQFVRAVVQGSKLDGIIDIPDAFRSKRVEVLILPFEEKVPASRRRKKFNPEDFEGALNIDPVELEKEIQRMRDEWERI
jgi:hypothetical protein